MLWRNLWTYVHYGSGLTIGACSIRYLVTVVKTPDDKCKQTTKKNDSRRPFMK